MQPSALKTEFRRDRFTWLAYFMLAFMAYMQSAPGPFVPLLRAELALTFTVAGLHLSAFALGRVVTGVTGDWFVRRFGRVFTFWGGAAGVCGGAILLIMGRTPVVTIGGMLFMGVFAGLLVLTVQSTLADRHGERRAVALTEANVAAMTSTALAPLLIGGFEAIGIGWRAAIAVGVVGAGMLFLRYRGETIPPALDDDDPVAGLGKRLPSRFWWYFVVVFLGVSVEWCIVGWGASYLASDSIGFAPETASTLMTVFFLPMIVARIAGSRLTRRYASRHLLLVAAVICIVGFPIFWLAPLPLFNVIGLFIAGLGVANFFPLALAAATNTAPRRADQVSARVSLSAALAILILPQALGTAADQIGLRSAFGVVPVLLFLMVIMLLLVRHRGI